MFDKLNYPNSSNFSQTRILSIYALISLFFTILGVVYLVSSVQIVFWILSNICLWLAIHDLCYHINNKTVWVLINLLYLAILIIGLVWCGEFNNSQNNTFRNIAPIIIVLGGLTMIGTFIKYNSDNSYGSPTFWFLVYFTLIWIVSAIYTVVPQSQQLVSK